MAQVVFLSPLGDLSSPLASKNLHCHLVPGFQQDQGHSLPSWWKQSYTSCPEGSPSQTSHDRQLASLPGSLEPAGKAVYWGETPGPFPADSQQK